MIFYHSRLADEPTPTGTIDFVVDVENSVETKVLHKT